MCVLSLMCCFIPLITLYRSNINYSALKIRLLCFPRFCQIFAVNKLRDACMLFLFSSMHALSSLFVAGILAETREAKSNGPQIFQFIPSACGGSLSNPDHFEELGLAVLGKDALSAAPKLEHQQTSLKVAGYPTGNSYFYALQIVLQHFGQICLVYCTFYVTRVISFICCFTANFCFKSYSQNASIYRNSAVDQRALVSQ